MLTSPSMCGQHQLMSPATPVDQSPPCTLSLPLSRVMCRLQQHAPVVVTTGTLVVMLHHPGGGWRGGGGKVERSCMQQHSESSKAGRGHRVPTRVSIRQFTHQVANPPCSWMMLPLLIAAVDNHGVGCVSHDLPTHHQHQEATAGFCMRSPSGVGSCGLPGLHMGDSNANRGLLRRHPCNHAHEYVVLMFMCRGVACLLNSACCQV